MRTVSTYFTQAQLRIVASIMTPDFVWHKQICEIVVFMYQVPLLEARLY